MKLKLAGYPHARIGDYFRPFPTFGWWIPVVLVPLLVFGGAQGAQYFGWVFIALLAVFVQQTRQDCLQSRLVAKP